MTIPLLLGYWSSTNPAQLHPGLTDKQHADSKRVRDEARRWPDANDFVDHDWAQGERQMVADYLERGTLVNQYRGHSSCRFCKRRNGSAELTDGVFCWPEGLAHYVWDHNVRLPGRFVAHVHVSPCRLRDAPRPAFLESGHRDRAWPGPAFARLLWVPKKRTSGRGLYVEADPTWWLRQDGQSDGAP